MAVIILKEKVFTAVVKKLQSYILVTKGRRDKENALNSLSKKTHIFVIWKE